MKLFKFNFVTFKKTFFIALAGTINMNHKTVERMERIKMLE